MPQRITLIHHPTVALKITGFRDPRFAAVASGAYLGNIYRRIMPPSIPRVAAVMERHVDAEVRIVDLRTSPAHREETARIVDWEGYRVHVNRIGLPFSAADEAIASSDWIGLTSHFTFESGVVRDLIAHARLVKPEIKVMVGGADVKARPMDYLHFDADYVCVGDFDPRAFVSHVGRQIVGPYRHPFSELTRPAFDKLEHLHEYSDSHDGPVPEGVRPPIGFVYFTRGCPRECDFCESRRSKFEAMQLDTALDTIEHYARSGVMTLNFADDNLLLMAATAPGRATLLEIFRVLREKRFAWEFPNGLEIGRFMTRDGLDLELLAALFSHELEPDGRLVGAYRVYLPLETFDRRDRYSKLKPLHEQRRVIQWIAGSGLPEIDFGVVVPPDADEDTFAAVRDGYVELQADVRSAGAARARYGIFHLIPIALFRGMRTNHSVYDFPEGWNFYFPVYHGTHMSARELFERRLDVVREIDEVNLQSMSTGQYAYR